MVRLRGSLALYDGYIAFQSSRVWCYEMPDEKMGDNLQLARRTAVSSKIRHRLETKLRRNRANPPAVKRPESFRVKDLIEKGPS
jgi:hypothetical protein